MLIGQGVSEDEPLNQVPSVRKDMSTISDNPTILENDVRLSAIRMSDLPSDEMVQSLYICT